MSEQQPGQQSDQALYVVVSPDGHLKVGTCDHCVIREQGRPARAWEPDGDRELDFPRDRLIRELARLGVVVQIEAQYVCP